MTVESSVTAGFYVGTGFAVDFPIPFNFFSNEEVRVFVDDAELLDGFAVSGGAGTTGTVTFLAPPALGAAVAIVRRTPLRQSLVTAADPDPADYERQLDLIVHMQIELRRLLDLALRFGESANVGSVPQLPSPSLDGQRALLLLATGALGLSAADPDSYEARVAAAEATVADMELEVDAALANAAAALAATSNFGGPLRYGTVTLVEGQADYTLLNLEDEPVASAGNFLITLGGVLLKRDTAYTLLAGGRGISLTATVVAAGTSPAAGELVAGDTLEWLLVAGSQTTNDIADAQVTAPKLADAAIVLSGAKVAAGTPHRLLWRGSDGKVAELALPAVGEAFGTASADTPGSLPIPAAASDANVTAKTGSGYVKASQIPLLGGEIRATLKMVGSGQVQATSGWAIVKTGTGVYRVNFPAAFASIHDYQVHIQIQNSLGARSVQVTTYATDHCIFETRTSGGSNLEDQPSVTVLIVVAKA